MPKFYTQPTFTLTDRQASTRGSAVGTLSDITNPNPYTFYQTASPGTGGVLNFTCTFSPAETIDSVHVIAENVSHVTVYNITASTSVITDQPTIETFDNRRALVFTSTTSPTAATGIRVSLTKTSQSAVVKIYAIKVMRQLMDLSITGATRSISRFEPLVSKRKMNIVPDLYGIETEEVLYGAYDRATTRYQIWHAANNLTECRQEINRIKKMRYEHPNFNFLDLDETGASDYESCYGAYFVPGALSTQLRGVKAISYQFTVAQQ